MVSSNKNINKQLHLFKDRKYNLSLLNFYNFKIKNDILVKNIIIKNNSNYSDELSNINN